MMHLNDKLKDACFQTVVRTEHSVLNHLENLFENEVLDDPMMAFGTIWREEENKKHKNSSPGL